MMLQLITPTMDHKDQVLSYKQEFLTNGDSMDGCAGLERDWSYEQWMKTCEDGRKGKNIPENWVPATLFLAADEDGTVVGMIHIRHVLNDALLLHGGHIGYSVRKSQRRKGYATKMLGLALLECKKLGIERALVTCAKTNIGSAKTIQKNGGVLENEVQEEKRITQRYWIAI